ncbi:MAG: hypothetical protein PHY18_00360 [Dehalococcoidales bacterium]|nr:hypothetical protein [Dehalococcoidales bacterium]
MTREMKQWRALKVVGWILAIVNCVNLGSILYGFGSVGHTPALITWRLLLAIAMIIVGAVLINRADKKVKEEKQKESM